jgi:hypothetical protein
MCSCVNSSAFDAGLIHTLTQEAVMPNMDYPGPCLSCIDTSCGLWDENVSESKDERSSEEEDRDHN